MQAHSHKSEKLQKNSYRMQRFCVHFLQLLRQQRFLLFIALFNAHLATYVCINFLLQIEAAHDSNLKCVGDKSYSKRPMRLNSSLALENG
jgi:hypothetical protein